jgi:glycosyltransferase involved in cell wall biosynthesis
LALVLPENKGISNAGGRYISFLDADDLWKPTKLQNKWILQIMHRSRSLL